MDKKSNCLILKLATSIRYRHAAERQVSARERNPMMGVS